MNTKIETLYCRMTAEMKERVEFEAQLRGESASVIVREALREYFDAKAGGRLKKQDSDPKSKRKAA